MKHISHKHNSTAVLASVPHLRLISNMHHHFEGLSLPVIMCIEKENGKGLVCRPNSGIILLGWLYMNLIDSI